MVLHLDVDLEAVLLERARQQGLAVEALALKTLRKRFLAPSASLAPRDEWERQLLTAASDCGVALSNEALSSEGLYE